MTETTATDPADILTTIIVAFLMPMFLTANGDIAFAQAAAIQTVNAYRARDNADLIAIAQIIAFGLAALGSLSLSMAGDLTLNMTLRLRGNANALNRSAEQNRRTLANRNPSPQPLFDPGADTYGAETSARLVQSEKRLAEVLAAQHAPEAPPAQPAKTPTPIKALTPTNTPLLTGTDQDQQQIWASAMAKVAGEFTASLPHLPPVERRMASMRAAVLNSCASDLLTGPLPPRLRPGDLDALIRPKTP
jgi:hypothetical protein